MKKTRESAVATVTGEQVRSSMQANGITRVAHHDCRLCGYMTAYIIADDGELYFDPGCECTGGAPWRPAGFAEAADWINIQNNPDVRDRIAAKFGLVVVTAA